MLQFIPIIGEVLKQVLPDPKARAEAEAKQMNLPIRWGGDWDMDNDLDDSNFLDLVHFEIKE